MVTPTVNYCYYSFSSAPTANYTTAIQVRQSTCLLMSHNAVRTLRRQEHVSRQLSFCSTLLRLLLRALGALLRSSSPRAQMSRNVDLLLRTSSPSTEETCSATKQTHVLFCIIDVKQQNKNSKHLYIFNDLKKSLKILFVVPNHTKSTNKNTFCLQQTSTALYRFPHINQEDQQ